MRQIRIFLDYADSEHPNLAFGSLAWLSSQTLADVDSKRLSILHNTVSPPSRVDVPLLICSVDNP